MKFLVIWRLDLRLLSAAMARSVARMTEHAQSLQESGKLVSRYHIVGAHGGAWIFDVESNDELERLLATSPVFNFAHYEVYPLTEMAGPPVAPPEEG